MLVALAAVCESSCEATLFAGCFMETSVGLYVRSPIHRTVGRVAAIA